MKYQLLPLDPDLDPVDFDTQSILDLARLGPYDKDAGVVYFDGVACLEPRPDKTTMGHVRKLEAELLAAKAERDDLAERMSEIVGLVDGVRKYAISHSLLIGECVAWQELKRATINAAAKGEATVEPAYPCEVCGADVGDAKNIHNALAHDGNTYQVCDDCAHQHHRWQEASR